MKEIENLLHFALHRVVFGKACNYKTECADLIWRSVKRNFYSSSTVHVHGVPFLRIFPRFCQPFEALYEVTIDIALTKNDLRFVLFVRVEHCVVRQCWFFYLQASVLEHES